MFKTSLINLQIPSIFTALPLRLASTIFSLSSGHGKCGVSVIRVSGDDTKKCVEKLAGTLPNPRFATLREIRDPNTNDIIDKGLVLWFPGPRSFTGEDSSEFQVHGGPAVVSAMLNALSKISGCRPADPGEFTRRAFFNGKLDLTEVEGLADLIHAETEFQRKQAIIQAGGHLSKLYNNWRTRLIKNIAHVEAFIDFSEDENIEPDVLDKVMADLKVLKEEISNHLKDSRKGERLRQGVRVAIVGQTNVGKSSFMNLICQRNISIVTNIQGTTRDVIESHYNLGEYPIILADTAGLRQSTDEVEKEGILRAKNYAKLADLVIIMMDAEKLTLDSIEFKKYQKSYIQSLGLDQEALENKAVITIVNKVDLVDQKLKDLLKSQNITTISCKNNYGMEDAILSITSELKNLCSNPSAETPTLSHARHQHHLKICLEQIEIFLENVNIEYDMAILVERLRNCTRSIGKITGQIRADDILNVIFRDFCIGK